MAITEVSLFDKPIYRSTADLVRILIYILQYSFLTYHVLKNNCAGYDSIAARSHLLTSFSGKTLYPIATSVSVFQMSRRAINSILWSVL